MNCPAPANLLARQCVALDLGYKSKKDLYRQCRLRFGFNPGTLRRAWQIRQAVDLARSEEIALPAAERKG